MKHVTVDQLAQTAGATIIDVREGDEYRLGHIPTARNLPLGSLAARIGELSSDAPLFVVCQSGARSARATATLEAVGLPAINVDGGTSAWIAAGLPTVVR